MKNYLRKIFFTFSMYLITHLIAFVVLPLGLFLIIIFPKTAPRLKLSFTTVLFWIVGKQIKLNGLGKIDPDQPYLIVANYPSFYAGFALINLFPSASIVAHAFISKIPILGLILKRIGAIFVDPKKVKKTRHALDSAFSGKAFKNNVIIFPEGERTKDGEFQRFRRGFIYILRQTNLNLLPLTLNGFYSLKPLNRFFINPDAELEIQIHAPIDNTMISKMSDGELLENTRQTILNSYRP